MPVARHPLPPELAGVPLKEVLRRHVGRFRDKKPDWKAFADAAIEGWRRAQHRFIGNTAVGQAPDQNIIPSRAFTLYSIMHVPPGHGNAAHTHEVEEVFFRPAGPPMMVFFEDEEGNRVETVLGPAGRQVPRPSAGRDPRLPQQHAGERLYAGDGRQGGSPGTDGLRRPEPENKNRDAHIREFEASQKKA